jgi:GR25 family glycosyltransferase involved in LPS biosynthesis
MIEHYYNDDNIFGERWFSYPNLYKDIVESLEDGDIIVEVGAWKGRSTSFLAVEIANSKKNVSLYVVDTWKGSLEHEGCDLDSLYFTFIENMKAVEKYYFPLHITSEEASKKFKDNSLKFVFLDASHEYEDVKKDIQNWLPKVKVGGILAGHDYYVDGQDWFPGVKKAVNEELSNISTQEDCWIFKKDSLISMKEKLKNFPSVNFISIEESQDRRNNLYKNFSEYGIENVTPHIFERYDDSKHSFIGEAYKTFCENGELGRAPVTSHLKAIKKWYFDTDEEYTFFCEDDLTFESVKYWNFTWSEFFDKLPKDWECVQLCLVREVDMFQFFEHGVKLRNRCWNDWSGCAYLLRRSHAKKLISNYHRNSEFNLDYAGFDYYDRSQYGWPLTPCIETIIFSHFSSIYVFPLFLEDVYRTKSSLHFSDETRGWNFYSYDVILEWWKENGKNLTIGEIINLP